VELSIDLSTIFLLNHLNWWLVSQKAGIYIVCIIIMHNIIWANQKTKSRFVSLAMHIQCFIWHAFLQLSDLWMLFQMLCPKHWLSSCGFHPQHLHLSRILCVCILETLHKHNDKKIHQSTSIDLSWIFQIWPLPLLQITTIGLHIFRTWRYIFTLL